MLILLNAFFAATEIAVISLNDKKIRRMAEDGEKTAKIIERIISEPGRFLATIQVGITLTGFMASAFAAENFADDFTNLIMNTGIVVNPVIMHNVGIVVITLILAYFTLVFGELVPKRIALQHSETISFKVARIITFLSKLTSLFVILLNSSSNGILRLLRIDPSAEKEKVTEEEIRMLVDVGCKEGSIEEDEQEMIFNIFEFNNKTAADAMTHRIDLTAIKVDSTQAEYDQMLKDSGHTRIPVYESDMDDIVGILHVRDYFYNRISENPRPVNELLRPVYSVPETVRADVLFSDMQRKKIHMVVVLDEYGGVSGVVTLEDLLEKIVGNIYEENEVAELEYEKIDEGTYRIRGTTDLDIVQELLKVELPIDEYDTLGGLVFGQLNEIPEDGTSLELEAYGLIIKVENIKERRVEWAKVCKGG